MDLGGTAGFAGCRINTASNGQALDVTATADVNGDGASEPIVADPTGGDAGRAALTFGHATAEPVDVTRLSAEEGMRVDATTPGQAAGTSVAAVPNSVGLATPGPEFPSSN